MSLIKTFSKKYIDMSFKMTYYKVIINDKGVCYENSHDQSKEAARPHSR